MPNPMDAILSRIQAGNQRRRENALNEIFAKSYEPGAAVPFVDEGAQAFGLPQEPGMVAGYEPGRINPQNALAQMAQSKEPGFALRAFELQKQLEDRELERQKVAAQANRDTAGRTPMSVEETIWFMKQPQDVQNKHLAIKRAQQVIDTGRDFRAVNQLDPTQTSPVAQRSLKPTEELDYVGNKATTEKSSSVAAEDLTKARIAFPKQEASADETIKLVDELLSHPGKKLSVGTSSVLPKIPGTDQAGFIARLDQLKGRQFLTAYETLKGGGTITEVEGKKAESALARMDRAQKEEEFDQAALDFKEAVKEGNRKLKEYAGVTDVTNQTPDTEKKVTKPKTGAIDSGFVFMGGDPGNPKNWKKAK